MKLGLQLGYWGEQPPTNHAELVATAEEAGYDTVFTAEAWGSDAFTPLAWWGRETTRIAAGHLGGRHILGLGVSGPQVAEGAAALL